MKRYLTAIVCAVLVLLLWGCNKDIAPDQTADSSTGENIVDTSTSDNSVDTPTSEALTQEELRWFNEEFFSNARFDAQGNVIFNIHNMFLACEYDSPEKIDLGVVFRQGLGSYSDVSQEEIALYSKVTGEDTMLDFSKITLEEMSAIFLENTGLHLSQTLKVGLDKLVYLEEYEAFYHRHGDTAYAFYSIDSGERTAGGTVTLYYLRYPFEDSPLYKVTLKPSGDTYLFVSNLPAE